LCVNDQNKNVLSAQIAIYLIVRIAESYKEKADAT